MQNNICDKCGKAGHIAPQTKVKLEKGEIEINIPDPNDPGEHIKQKVSYDKPVMKKVRKQNPFSGLIEETEEPELEYLQDRIIRVELALGFSERISREFCVECIEEVKEQLKSTWNTLESYEPK